MFKLQSLQVDYRQTLFQILPVILAFLMASCIFFEAGIQSPRWFLFGLFFILRLISAPFAFHFLVILLPLLEVFTLQSGYPNQFVIEFGIVGFVLGHLTMTKFEKKGSNPLASWERHPLALALLFAAVSGLMIWVIGITDFILTNGLPVSRMKLFQGVVSGAFIADVRNNIFHSLSISLGYFITLSALVSLSERPGVYRCTFSSVSSSLVFGGWLVAAIGLGQYLTYLSSDFTVEIGGPFQSGNHISFYLGFITLVALALFLEKPSLVRSGALMLTVAVSITPFFTGRGRTAWVGLAAAFSLFLVGALFWGLKKERRLLFALLFMTLIIIAGGYYCFSQGAFSNWFYRNGILNPFELLLSGDLTRIIFAGGRERHILEAINMLISKWPSGIGLGNFMRLSERQAYTIHNTYLAWPVELGFFSVLTVPCVIFLSFRYPLAAIFEKRNVLFHLAIVSILVYLGTCLFMDTFFWYRTILNAVAIFLFGYLLSSHALSKPMSSTFFYGTVLVALVQGFFSLASPQALVKAEHVYRSEGIGEKAFAWVAGKKATSLSAGSCVEFSASSTQGVALEVSSRNVTRHGWLEPGIWQSICLCNDTIAQQPVEIGVTRSDIVALHPGNSSHDYRVLGFASTTLATHKLSEMQLATCDQAFQL